MTMKVKFQLFLITIFLFPFFSFFSIVKAENEAVITVQLENLYHVESDLQGVEIELYRVGDVSDYGEPKIRKQYGVRNYPETAEQTEAAALYITTHITSQPDKVILTSEEGTAVFAGLKQGVYLLVAKNPNTYGIISPVLVHLPFYEEIDGVREGPLFNITVKPKASVNTSNHREPEKNMNIETEPGVQTGDNSAPLFYFMLAGLAVAVFLCLFIYKRKGGSK